MVREIRAEIWDANLETRQAIVWQPEVTAKRRWNDPDEAHIQVDPDDPAVTFARQEGACVRLLVDGAVFVSGRVSQAEGDMASLDQGVISTDSWWAELSRVVGVPVPIKPGSNPPTPGSIADQGGREQWVWTAPVEDICKALVYDQAAVYAGLPVDVEAGHGRGPTVTMTCRYQPILDVMQSAMDYSGLVFSLDHVSDDPSAWPVVFACRTPVEHTVPLDVQGVVEGGSWSVKAPTATQAIVGGWGEGTARKIVTVTAPNHAQWLRTVFVDARDVQPDPAANPPVTEAAALAELQKRGEAALSGAHGVTRLDLRLTEEAGFAYRAPFEVGDLVRVNIAPGWTVLDRITEVTLTATAENGVVIEPLVGGVDDSGDARIARAIRSAHVGIRKLMGAT